MAKALCLGAIGMSNSWATRDRCSKPPESAISMFESISIHNLRSKLTHDGRLFAMRWAVRGDRKLGHARRLVAKGRDRDTDC